MCGQVVQKPGVNRRPLRPLQLKQVHQQNPQQVPRCCSSLFHPALSCVEYCRGGICPSYSSSVAHSAWYPTRLVLVCLACVRMHLVSVYAHFLVQVQEEKEQQHQQQSCSLPAAGCEVNLGARGRLGADQFVQQTPARESNLEDTDDEVSHRALLAVFDVARVQDPAYMCYESDGAEPLASPQKVRAYVHKQKLVQ